MMSRTLWFGITLMLVDFTAPAVAQYVNPDTCSMADANCQQVRRERADKADADYSERQKEQQKNQAERERERRALLKTPPLAAGANPLLGHWRRVNTSAPARNWIDNIGAGLEAVLVCDQIQGPGPSFEFRADALVHGSRPVSRMQYRAGPDGVVHALGESGILYQLAFGMQGRDRIFLKGVTTNCVWERVGAQSGPSPGQATMLQRWLEDAGFRCGGRTLILVKFCPPGGPNVDCSVCQLREPKDRSADSCGRMTRGELAELIGGCEEGKVVLADDGAATFAPAARK